MRLVIFGAAGLLGRSLVEHCRAAGDDVHPFTHADCDIADGAAVTRALLDSRAEIAFNAAAATDVDRCEREPKWAFRANAIGPFTLAALAEQAEARLVHVSTDYVFSGEKGSPYDERDDPAPLPTLSVYARSKLEGERMVLARQPRAVVARVAWLYGPGGKSFVSRIPALLRERGALAAISDQSSSPTYAPDAAALLRELALRAKGGVYHVAGAGTASYYEIALEAAAALGIPAERVRPQPSSAVPRPARRPRATPLVSVRLAEEGFAPLRDWREAYREFVRSGA